MDDDSESTIINVQLSDEQIKGVLTEFHDESQSLFDEKEKENSQVKASTANNIFELIEDTVETVKNMLGQLKLELLDMAKLEFDESSKK
uniref:Uncharacterized protein n=1 Tax=Strigamia maritima TaxID=126957 RepID=T1IVE9_STRMM